jgi:predicted HAD superfamily Cof-like phosphohydrolase
MNPFQEAVAKFHHQTGGRGSLDTPEGRELRAKLIMEEAVETVAALGFYSTAVLVNNEGIMVADFHRGYDQFHLEDFIDGLCDLTYVTMGGAVNADIDLQRHFDEVHRANMRKLDGPKRADGKQLKPEGWVGPDHGRILELYSKVSETPAMNAEELAWSLQKGNNNGQCSCGQSSGQRCCG